MYVLYITYLQVNSQVLVSFQVNNYVVYDGFFSSTNPHKGGGSSGVRRARIYMGKLQYVDA